MLDGSSITAIKKRFSEQIFFVCVVLGFELRAYTLSHSTSLFLMGFFQDRVS
jgi:hypothetical protein